MGDFDIRKTKISTESVWHDRGPRLSKPLLVGSALAVIRNPYAGRYEPDLLGFQSDLRELGRQLANNLVTELGGVDKIEAYGKGMIVGEERGTRTCRGLARSWRLGDARGTGQSQGYRSGSQDNRGRRRAPDGSARPRTRRLRA